MKKTMKKVTAVTLAAAMALAVPFTAAADGGSGAGSGTSSGTTPSTTASTSKVYFKENVTTVVVPTKLTVAFNPNNLDITIDGVSNTSDIVSRPVAIVSEATKDKKVAVSFKVESSNSAVKFVDTKAAADTGTDLNVCLQLVAATSGIAIPASGASGTTTISVNSGTGERSYAPASLAKATMTAAGSGTSGTVTIKDGSAVGFRLDKASYNYNSIDLDTGSGATSNKISGTLSGLGTTGSTAFNLTGYLNDNADWYSLEDTDTITITPTYSISDATTDDKAITGMTGFMGATTASSSSTTTVTNADPTIVSIGEYDKANASNVVITFTLGSGTGAVEADAVTLLQGSSDASVNTSKYTVDMTNKTVTIASDAGFLTGASADIPVKVQLKKDGSVVKTLTGTITVK